MTAVGWSLATVGLFFVFCGVAAKAGNAPSLRAVADELAQIPATLRRVLQADADAHMLLGVGLVMMAAGLLAFMVGSLLP